MAVALAAGQQGVAYSDFIDVEGGIQPYVFTVTAGALPAGLSINAATGEISGTPTTVENAAFTVLVTDSGSWTDTQDETIAIAAGVPVLTSINPASKVQNSATFALSLAGSAFNAASVVKLGETELATTYLSPILLEAVLPTDEMTEVDDFIVTVTNPNVGTSAGAMLSVLDPDEPALTRVTGRAYQNDGSPARNTAIRIYSSDQNERWPMATRDVIKSTNRLGDVDFTLLRNSKVKLKGKINGIENGREITVPDTDAVDINDLI